MLYEVITDKTKCTPVIMVHHITCKQTTKKDTYISKSIGDTQCGTFLVDLCKFAHKTLQEWFEHVKADEESYNFV